MNAIELLWQNDPERTDIVIRLGGHDARSASDLAQALQQNPFVTELQLKLRGVQRADDWYFLLRVIATRANLETVKLQDAISAESRNAPAALVRSSLQAIQQNTAIRMVELSCLRLPADISTFLDNASSITSFTLWGCDMEPAELEQGARDLAAALQRNTNIQTLKICKLEDIYAIPILEDLQLNTSVETFSFYPRRSGPSDAASLAIQNLLEFTTSIQKFEVGNASFRENQFGPIAQAITSSECVCKLKFSGVSFVQKSVRFQLRSILRNKRNLATLSLDSCNFARNEVNGVIISIIKRPASSLRCFEFQTGGTWEPVERVFPGIRFRNLLEAVQTSKLERFKIGSIETSRQLQTLLQSIPSMPIRELDVVFDGPIFDGQVRHENANPRQNLLLAVKNNFILQSVNFLRPGYDRPSLLESAEDKQRLALYTSRNESLDEWVKNPERVVNQKVWPDALGLAERAGPNALFRGLRSVLGRDYVKLPV